jgi:hypothetical protein
MRASGEQQSREGDGATGFLQRTMSTVQHTVGDADKKGDDEEMKTERETHEDTYQEEKSKKKGKRSSKKRRRGRSGKRRGGGKAHSSKKAGEREAKESQAAIEARRAQEEGKARRDRQTLRVIANVNAERTEMLARYQAYTALHQQVRCVTFSSRLRECRLPLVVTLVIRCPWSPLPCVLSCNLCSRNEDVLAHCFTFT